MYIINYILCIIVIYYAVLILYYTLQSYTTTYILHLINCIYYMYGMIFNIYQSRSFKFMDYLRIFENLKILIFKNI